VAGLGDPVVPYTKIMSGKTIWEQLVRRFSIVGNLVFMGT
jgi:hypothetical protein